MKRQNKRIIFSCYQFTWHIAVEAVQMLAHIWFLRPKCHEIFFVLKNTLHLWSKSIMLGWGCNRCIIYKNILTVGKPFSSSKTRNCLVHMSPNQQTTYPTHRPEKLTERWRIVAFLHPIPLVHAAEGGWHVTDLLLAIIWPLPAPT